MLHRPCWINRWRFIATTALLVSLAAVPVRGEAHTWDKTGWTQCSLDGLYGVVASDAGDMAWPRGAWSPDGHWQSFTDLMEDALDRWNNVLASANAPVYLDFWGFGSGAAIEVLYNDLDGSTQVNSGGETRSFSNDPGTCSIHGSGSIDIFAADIEMDTYQHWFTQMDSRRAWWEGNCPHAGGYTCSKRWDFGQNIAHEFGHTLVIGHPLDYDNTAISTDHHLGFIVPSAYGTAKCGVNNDYATMCKYHYEYRSTGRTLASWDVDSLNGVY